MAKYNLYTFTTFAKTFPFTRLSYNLKNFRTNLKCRKENNEHNLTCVISYKQAKIPLFFNMTYTEYIDEKTGKVKKEENLTLSFDFDFYITLLDDIKKRYNINLFYDYQRKRRDN